MSRFTLFKTTSFILLQITNLERVKLQTKKKLINKKENNLTETREKQKEKQ